jgi:hypothetical protein
MPKKTLIVSALLTAATMFATPSFALSGAEALDQCVKNATRGCKVRSTTGGEIIIDGGQGGEVYCPSLVDDCMVIQEKIVGTSGRPRKEDQVPESVISGSGGDTGVPGTGSGEGHSFGTAGPDRGPTKPGVIQ